MPSSLAVFIFLSIGRAAHAAQVSEDDMRFVEKRMADLPNQTELNMSIQMLGFEVEGSHVLGHLVKIDNPSGRVSLAPPPGGCGTREFTTVTAQAHSPKCRLAINAGYFNVTDGACIGNLVADGNLIQSVPLNESNVNFGIRDGRFAIGYYTPAEVQEFDQMVSGVTWLVKDGKSYVEQGWAEANITVQTSGDKYISNLASRTAVGIDKKGRLIILQVDGSIAVGNNKRGVNMYQLADLLIEHGAVNAVNLDGGGSSAMARDGVLVNYPSDSKPPSCDDSGKFQCERPVSTVLCVHELPEVAARSEFGYLGTGSLPGYWNVLTQSAVGVVVFLAGAASLYGLSLLGCKWSKAKAPRTERARATSFTRQVSDSSEASTATAASP